MCGAGRSPPRLLLASLLLFGRYPPHPLSKSLAGNQLPLLSPNCSSRLIVEAESLESRMESD
jgi:hypothetical protein